MKPEPRQDGMAIWGELVRRCTALAEAVGDPQRALPLATFPAATDVTRRLAQ